MGIDLDTIKNKFKTIGVLLVIRNIDSSYKNANLTYKEKNKEEPRTIFSNF